MLEDHSCLQDSRDKLTWRDPAFAGISPLRSEDALDGGHFHTQPLVSFDTTECGPAPNNLLVETGEDPR